jgi:hypothetical protein
MDLRQLLNRPEKPKPKIQLLFAHVNNSEQPSKYCIVLICHNNRNKVLHSTDDIYKHELYQCYSPEWSGHNGFDNKINHVFCKLYNTPTNKFWNIRGNKLTPVTPEEFPYKKFLEYKNIEEEIVRIQAEIGIEHELGRLEGLYWSEE